ncbi:MAG: hypothetical protein ACD_46C00263G0006 [uncultured bacterium]|nr:MAG: hypothetical protein ACD_46C00263G0006 [uncultured bacterium]
MKILILGGDGMLGHQLFLNLKKNHVVFTTLRQDTAAYKHYQLFDHHNSYFKIDVCRESDIKRVIDDVQPQVIINAVGIVKQRDSAKEFIPSLEINALFPHRLARLCEEYKIRMIHFSTDCVFSGRQGKYTENDPSDAEDLYGKSKHLGELYDKHCVTIRSSIIGLELARKTGLIEWFLAQRGIIKGFRRAIYSGLTTQEMNRVIECILIQYPDLYGVWHVSSEFINKYELLMRLAKKLGRNDIEIQPDDKFICDRSLIGAAFKKATGYQAPSWDMMLDELAHQIKQRNELNISREIPCNY